MKTTNRLITTWIIASALFVLNVFPAFAAEAEYVPGQVIVKFRPGTTQTQMDTANRHAGGHGQKNASGAFKIDLPADDDDDVVSAMMTYANDPAVQYVEPNYIYHAFVTTPNDPFYPAFPYNGGINPGQWNLRTIGTDTAWDTWKGSSSVIIAVIDTGVSVTHPDLAGKITTGLNAGYDFVDNDNNPTDANGHGTHVAGIAAAISNNGTGVAGVDWNARIMPIRVLDATGSGSSTDVAAGIYWAGDHGAKVINMSLGDSAYSQTVQDAINHVHDEGVVVVAAAGNDALSGNPVFYPASNDHVISVAATNQNDNWASFSNYNSHVDVAAPGVAILSTYWSAGSGNGYGWGDGTSMAASHVAGLAALIASKNPTWTPDQIEQKIKSSATDLGAAGRDNLYGYGRINASAALGNTPQILINGSSAAVSTNLATLTVSVGSVTFIPTQMRFSNNALAWSAWETYGSIHAAWDITSGAYGGVAGDGVKTVYLQLKDNGSGLSDAGGAMIIYDTTPPSGTLSVNAGAVYTNTTIVTLNLSATDAGGSGLFQMRFSSDNSSWSSWESFATTKSGWYLGATDGTKTAYVQYKDNLGYVSAGTISDTIVLETVAPTSQTISINSGSTRTSAALVTLTSLSAIDPGSGVYRMRFSNNNATWSAWETFVSTKANWDLTAVAFGGSINGGTRTVYVEFIDNAGNVSGSASDSIVYSTPNRGYIIGLYRDLLGRGDTWLPMDENEIAPWVNAVNAGMPGWEIAWRMMSSHEYHRSFVDERYTDVLGRPIENDGDTGRDVWANAMDNGMASRYVRAALTGSNEFFASMGFTNVMYVEFLYMNILQRPYEQSGRQAWVNAINSGSQNRIQVAYNFMCSYEFYGKFITDSYISFLNRPSAQYVQESEINGWRNAMFAGLSEEALLARMYGSDEYFARTSGI